MINAEDEIYIDDRSSCTRDEAIAKMLGWMQGHVRKRFIKVTARGVSEDQLADLASLDEPLLEMLADLREVARQDFIQTFEDDADLDVIIKKDESVAMLDSLINKAVAYGFAFDQEAGMPQSTLCIDQSATEETGITHFTLNSVDQWSRRQWGVAIEPSFSQDTISGVAIVPQELVHQSRQAIVEGTEGKKAVKTRRRQLDQVEAIVAEIRRQGFEPLDIPKIEPGKRGLKAQVSTALQKTPLFGSVKVFDNAWERALKGRDIAYKK